MTISRSEHRFISIEQVVRATQPATSDLPTLFREWGLTNSVQEAMWVIAFDNVEGLKTVIEVARGGYADVIAHVPVILGAVLAAQTDRFYIAHNHPSGPVRPTPEDVEMTAAIMHAANAAGLSFEDSIIVGPKGWFSFYDEGLLTHAQQPDLKAASKKGGRK